VATSTEEFEMIDWRQLLARIEVDDKDIVLSYLVVYSRFEYALKRSGYVRREQNGVSADWECFIRNIRHLFDQRRTADLATAVIYLLENPPQAQTLDENDHLKFANHPSAARGSVPLRLYHCARIVRNNLFHGGKYPDAPRSDTARDSKLLRYCHTVLEEFLLHDATVRDIFEETA
jgi:hypothetical protein